MSGSSKSHSLVASKGTLSGELLPQGQPTARTPTPRRLCLRDIDAIRREMGRVYRDARRGQIDTSEAARLVYILGELRKAYEASTLERRLAALEREHDEGT